MDNISLLEECYKLYSRDLQAWLPEDIVDVDLEVLWEMNLVEYLDESNRDPSLTRYFHVIETEEKITLVNDEFVVWIVPEIVDGSPKTFTLIALNDRSHPKLAMAFTTCGVYNTSKLVLRVLEKYLMEIQENERSILQFKGQ